MLQTYVANACPLSVRWANNYGQQGHHKDVHTKVQVYHCLGDESRFQETLVDGMTTQRPGSLESPTDCPSWVHTATASQSRHCHHKHPHTLTPEHSCTSLPPTQSKLSAYCHCFAAKALASQAPHTHSLPVLLQSQAESACPTRPEILTGDTAGSRDAPVFHHEFTDILTTR